MTPPYGIVVMYTGPCTVVQSRRTFTTKKALVVSSMNRSVASNHASVREGGHMGAGARVGIG